MEKFVIITRNLFGGENNDRNRKEKMPIKSLTLRNICITTFNIFIIINYVILLILIKK